MKLLAFLVLLMAFLACSLAQPLNAAQTQQAPQQQPNFLQLMLMGNMFDSQWLPLMYMGQQGGGGMRNLFPFLMWNNIM